MARLIVGIALVALMEQVVVTGHTGRQSPVSQDMGERQWIPSGEFIMGSSRRDLDYAVSLCRLGPPSLCDMLNLDSEAPPHRIRTSSYHIGTTEVSNRQYESCIRAGACLPRIGHHPDLRLDASDKPVVDVTHGEATVYCRWRGGRLPTEAEWERAARGPTPRRFPWGNLWNNALCNHGQFASPHHDESDGHRYSAPVISYPSSRSPFGLFNVSGNVWEWVSDWYDDNTYNERGHSTNPSGPSSGQMRVIRGGSWSSPPTAVRVTQRGRAPEESRSIDIGFRCAWDEL